MSTSLYGLGEAALWFSLLDLLTVFLIGNRPRARPNLGYRVPLISTLL